MTVFYATWAPDAMPPIQPDDSVLWRGRVYLAIDRDASTGAWLVRERGNAEAVLEWAAESELVRLTEMDAVERLMAAAKR